MFMDGRNVKFRLYVHGDVVEVKVVRGLELFGLAFPSFGGVFHEIVIVLFLSVRDLCHVYVGEPGMVECRWPGGGEVLWEFEVRPVPRVCEYVYECVYGVLEGRESSIGRRARGDFSVYVRCGLDIALAVVLEEIVCPFVFSGVPEGGQVLEDSAGKVDGVNVSPGLIV